jgi:hypothetical protein
LTAARLVKSACVISLRGEKPVAEGGGDGEIKLLDKRKKKKVKESKRSTPQQNESAV